MTQTATSIKTLLNSNKLSADRVTHPLRDIGDGNMLEGVKTVFKYAYIQGAKKYFVVGGLVTAAVISTAYVGYRGVKFLVSDIENKKEHKESGAKIYAVLSNNKADISKEEEFHEKTEKSN